MTLLNKSNSGAADRSYSSNSTTSPTLQKQSFENVLSACGTPPSLFTDADGTSQRESLRRWHLGTILPLARILETELSEKLEADVGLKFDNYPLDLSGRAKAFQSMVGAGMEPAKAAGLAGLMEVEG